ncbi:hypothetical protein DXG01_007820 [Tephrocybe rancida]|nr:hypothetical protein DXG01_007820 [Tephrocybe rancida]
MTTIFVVIVFLLVRAVAVSRPRAVVAHLDGALNRVVDKFYALEISQQADDMAKIRTALTSIQLQGIDLRQDALGSAGPGNEIMLIIRGHWWRVAYCLRRVYALDSEIETMRAGEEKRRIEAGERAT